jgi:uncharacterized protein YtpQ (UPF0354 family)
VGGDDVRTLLKALILGSALAAGGVGAAAAGTGPAPGDLATKVAARLRTALPDYDVEIVDKLTIKFGPHGQAREQLNLDRISAFCDANPSNCDQILPDYVAKIAVMARQMNEPITADKMRVVVRTASYIEEVEKEMRGGKGGGPVYAPYAADLVEVCEFDFPTSARIASKADLDKLGLSPQEALARGEANTRAALPPLAGQLRKIEGREFGVLDGDAGYTSSRFLLHDDWAPLASSLDGKLIVAVPADNLLLYGEDRDADSESALAELAGKTAKTGERPISLAVFRWTRTGWEIAHR